MSDSAQIMQPIGWGLRALLPGNYVSRFLSDDGTEGGAAPGGDNANVDGSSVAVKFWAEFPRDAYLSRMIIHIKDSGNLAADKYGAITLLTNGVAVQITEADGTTVLADLTGARDPKSVTQWSALCYDGTEHSYGSGDNVFAVRWTFSMFGGPVMLQAGQRIQVIIQDDLTGLTDHSFHISGSFE